MTRHVRSWALAALAAFALAGAATPSLAEITYNVTNYALGQNGWSLAGTITVSGLGTYSYDSSAITAWDVTVSKGSTNYLFANNAGVPSANLFGTLNATSSKLLLNDGAFDLFSNPDPNESVLTWSNFGPDSSTYFANNRNVDIFRTGALNPVDGGAWVLGTTGSAAVPEIDPAMGGSALSLVAGVLAMIEQRRRRAMLVA